MFTIDASVHVNALNPHEPGTETSRKFLAAVFSSSFQAYSPTLLLVEVAAAIARALNDARVAQALAESVRNLPGQHWVPLDDSLTEEAARLAALGRLRGADAVYAAVVHRYQTILVSRDRQQLDRLQNLIPVLSPAEALSRVQARNSGG